MTDDRDRDDEGNFTKKVTDDEIVQFVSGTSMCTTGKVAEAFDYTPQGAYRRLDQLVDDGRLDKQMAGASNVWTVAGES